jgi:threonine dehydrogenase-like Zn-dependent dehydrogenase
LKLAAKRSADVVINNHEEDVVKAVHRRTKGKHVPVVIDTVQGEAVQKEYMPLLEPARGQVVYSGFSPEPSWASMALLQQKEITAHFVAGWTRPRMQATFRLMAAGKMRVKPLITHTVPYTRGPEMYEMIRSKSHEFMGVTFDWREAESS